MPSKLKIGASGCPNSCAEPAIKDIGIMGTAKRYTLMVGGSAGAVPKLAEVVAKELSEEEVLKTVDKILNLYKNSSKKRDSESTLKKLALRISKTGSGCKIVGLKSLNL